MLKLGFKVKLKSIKGAWVGLPSTPQRLKQRSRRAQSIAYGIVQGLFGRQATPVGIRKFNETHETLSD